MKIERATQLLFLLLISQGGNAAYANLPRGASASPVQVSAQANKITVSGTVVDVNGEPLVGVSVLEKGTGNGTITDMDGNFTLSAGEGAALEISYVGYQNLTVSAKETLGVLVMKEDTEQLDEVVVTALGIKRSQKALSYNVQEVKNDVLTKVKDANFVNSLNGKVAGVSIQRSASGVGGGTRVVMRGNKSIKGDNNVLYVIDGVPMGNQADRTGDGTGFGADYPVDCVMRDCLAIGCGKNATEDSFGASGFGVGVGLSEDESMVIENCTSSANTKFGFFFEHQSLYRLNGVGARRAKGFQVTNCTAWGNLINFGGNRAYDVVYDYCVSDQPKKSDDELYTDYAFTFVEHSVRILVRNATVDQMYTDVLADPSSSAAIEWALSRNVAHVGASGNNEFRPENSITRAEAAEFFWRYAGRPGMLPLRYDYFDDPSSDVSADSFCADAVRWLEDDEIAAGNNFRAEDKITIQEICLAMLRYAYLVEDASSEASRALTLSGEDTKWETPSKPSSQEEEKVALDWACEQGIVTKAETADSKVSFTRARMMGMLQALDNAKTTTAK